MYAVFIAFWYSSIFLDSGFSYVDIIKFKYWAYPSLWVKYKFFINFLASSNLSFLQKYSQTYVWDKVLACSDGALLILEISSSSISFVLISLYSIDDLAYARLTI